MSCRVPATLPSNQTFPDNAGLCQEWRIFPLVFVRFTIDDKINKKEKNRRSKAGTSGYNLASIDVGIAAGPSSSVRLVNAESGERGKQPFLFFRNGTEGESYYLRDDKTKKKNKIRVEG